MKLADYAALDILEPDHWVPPLTDADLQPLLDAAGDPAVAALAVILMTRYDEASGPVGWDRDAREVIEALGKLGFEVVSAAASRIEEAMG